jgi:hypothetical protein
MKIGRLILSGILAGGLTAGAGALAADVKPAAPKADMPSNEQMMEQMMELAKPGEGHERLKPMAGTWKTSVKSWDGGPEPSVSEGECTDQWVMDGRYIKEECTGTFAQMPFQGMGITGYDNGQKKYVSTWIDTMGTGIMMSTGTADKTGKIFTFHGMMPDPTSGKMTKVRMVTRVVDDGSHVFTMYVSMGPKGEQKMMEITYTRK